MSQFDHKTVEDYVGFQLTCLARAWFPGGRCYLWTRECTTRSCRGLVTHILCPTMYRNCPLLHLEANTMYDMANITPHWIFPHQNIWINKIVWVSAAIYIHVVYVSTVVYMEASNNPINTYIFMVCIIFYKHSIDENLVSVLYLIVLYLCLSQVVCVTLFVSSCHANSCQH